MPASLYASLLLVSCVSLFLLVLRALYLITAFHSPYVIGNDDCGSDLGLSKVPWYDARAFSNTRGLAMADILAAALICLALHAAVAAACTGRATKLAYNAGTV